LTQFPGEKEFLLDDEVPGEVATAEIVTNEWIMKFDGSFMASSRGAVLYHGEGETIALSLN